MPAGHTASEAKQAVTVTCKPCGHTWIGFYLPLPIKDAARVMGRLCCPMCAAGADKIVIFDGSKTPQSDEQGVAK
jgi:hypothetical protein